MRNEMIYIVRHGQTDWNNSGRYGGQIDVELNKVGIEQAKNLRNILKNIKFDKVYVSPLKRTLKTATIIYDGDLIIDDRIKERSNGELEGKLKSDIKESIDFNDPDEHRYNIENIIDFRKRIKSFYDDILYNYHGENILIVTHAGVGIYLRCFFEGEPDNYLDYKMKNGQVLQYKIDK
jgi:broad specificity phosphatase PhoE